MASRGICLKCWPLQCRLRPEVPDLCLARPSALENPPSCRVPIWIPCVLIWSSTGKCFVIHDDSWFCIFLILQISSICWGSTKLSKTSCWWGLQRNCYQIGPRSTDFYVACRLEPSWRALLVCDSLKLKDNGTLEVFRSGLIFLLETKPLNVASPKSFWAIQMAEVVVDACIWWCAFGLRSFPDDLCSRQILGDTFSVFFTMDKLVPARCGLDGLPHHSYRTFLQGTVGSKGFGQRWWNRTRIVGNLPPCRRGSCQVLKLMAVKLDGRKLQLWNLRSDYHWTLGKEFAGMVVLKLALTEAWDRCCEDRLCWDLCQASQAWLSFMNHGRVRRSSSWLCSLSNSGASLVGAPRGGFFDYQISKILPNYSWWADVLNHTQQTIKKNREFWWVLGRENLYNLACPPSNHKVSLTKNTYNAGTVTGGDWSPEILRQGLVSNLGSIVLRLLFAPIEASKALARLEHFFEICMGKIAVYQFVSLFEFILMLNMVLVLFTFNIFWLVLGLLKWYISHMCWKIYHTI